MVGSRGSQNPLQALNVHGSHGNDQCCVSQLRDNPLNQKKIKPCE